MKLMITSRAITYPNQKDRIKQMREFAVSKYNKAQGYEIFDADERYQAMDDWHDNICYLDEAIQDKYIYDWSN